MHHDEKAQLSIDFLGGFVIVFFCLVTVFLFLPSLFSTMQNPSIDLHPVAYRTAILMAEDTGWWNNVTTGSEGYNWEDHLNETSRIGLASVKYGKGDACLLSGKKILAFISLYNKSDPKAYEKIQDLLGLKSSTRKYNYNLTFRYPPGGEIWKVKKNESGIKRIYNMTYGDPIPTSGNVEKYVRIFGIGKGLYPEYGTFFGPNNVPSTRYYPLLSDNGGQDPPLRLVYPIKTFKLYDYENNPSATAEVVLELLVTTNLAYTRNLDFGGNDSVIKWTRTGGWSGGNCGSGPGSCWNGLDWTVDSNGLWSRNFEDEINAKLASFGAQNGTEFLFSIQYKNCQSNINLYSDTWTDDEFFQTNTTIKDSFGLEVCIW